MTKTKIFDFKIAEKKPHFVVSQEFMNDKWQIRHIHYFKYKFEQSLEFFIENYVINSIYDLYRNLKELWKLSK